MSSIMREVAQRERTDGANQRALRHVQSDDMGLDRQEAVT